MQRISLGKNMMRRITKNQHDNYIDNENGYLIPKSSKKIIPNASQILKSPTTSKSTNNFRHEDYVELKEEVNKLVENVDNEEILLDLFSSGIKTKYLKMFQDHNILQENMIFLISEFLQARQFKQNKFIFKSQVVLIRISNNSLNYEYKYFKNGQKNIPDDYHQHSYFLYIININKHWALTVVEIKTRKCSIYYLCKGCNEHLFALMSKIHKNFLNFEIEEFILNEFFSNQHGEDKNEINCSLILNYLLIKFYSQGNIGDLILSSDALISNKEKILKIIYNFIKKMKSTSTFASIPENKDFNYSKTQIEKRKSVLPSALKRNNRQTLETNFPSSSALKLKSKTKHNTSMNSLSKISSRNLPTLQLQKTTPSKTQFSSAKYVNKVVLNKSDIVPIINDIKSKIIEEIIEKVNTNENKPQFFNKTKKIEDFNAFQNHLFFNYYNNPQIYGYLLAEYNKKYYSYLMKSFGMTDNEYASSFS